MNINGDWTRFFLVFGIQSALGITFLVLAYKILKRKRSKITIYLGAFFIIEFLVVFNNVVIIILPFSPIVVLLYLLAYFLYNFAIVFYILFLLSFFQEQLNLNIQKQIILVIFYSFIIFCLLALPEGIKFKVNENWRPQWSWMFLILNYVVITLLYNIPIIFFSHKLYSKFENPRLKKRIKYLLLGTGLLMIHAYGLVLYNTWENEIFRTIWSFYAPLIMISAYFLYYGIGKNM
ncbi:MAG: conserved membrane protein of unknown function [Promethearchaeota archaeon]|nr:MAG: conserved membrane protein of unknown function [Candidatus Lokiarchaeota archaeon]